MNDIVAFMLSNTCTVYETGKQKVVIINVPLCPHRMDGSTGHTEHKPKDDLPHQGQNFHTPHTCPKKKYIINHSIWLGQFDSDNEFKKICKRKKVRS